MYESLSVSELACHLLIGADRCATLPHQLNLVRMRLEPETTSTRSSMPPVAVPTRVRTASGRNKTLGPRSGTIRLRFAQHTCWGDGDGLAVHVEQDQAEATKRHAR